MADLSVAALWRYPVKSMAGEELDGADVTASGLHGDRAYALVDRATGRVGSAKSEYSPTGMKAFPIVSASAGV